MLLEKELKDEDAGMRFQEQTGRQTGQLDITETLTRGDGHIFVAKGNHDGKTQTNMMKKMLLRIVNLPGGTLSAPGLWLTGIVGPDKVLSKSPTML